VKRRDLERHLCGHGCHAVGGLKACIVCVAGVCDPSADGALA
jgi:hypothetical protein